MLLQQQISHENNASLVGKTLEVLVEQQAETGIYEARSRRDVPEIDGIVFVHTKKEHRPGEWIRVRITDFLEYDLIGEEIDEYCE